MGVMPTEKQNLAYIAKRIENYKAAEKLYISLASERPVNGTRLLRQADSYRSNAKALELVEYYMKNGKESDELTAPVQSEHKDGDTNGGTTTDSANA